MLINDIQTFETHSSDNSSIILGDSIEVLKQMESNSVDLIFADPPYNIGKDFGINKDKWANVDL